MTATITAETAANLDDAATYEARYVDNLRTGLAHTFGIVSGAQARQMLARSADPRRLVFAPVA